MIIKLKNLTKNNLLTNMSKTYECHNNKIIIQ